MRQSVCWILRYIHRWDRLLHHEVLMISLVWRSAAISAVSKALQQFENSSRLNVLHDRNPHTYHYLHAQFDCLVSRLWWFAGYWVCLHEQEGAEHVFHVIFCRLIFFSPRILHYIDTEADDVRMEQKGTWRLANHYITQSQSQPWKLFGRAPDS